MKRILMAAILLTAAQFAQANNDYPTLERVDHVLTCMRTLGGQTVDNLYACACEIDVIAQHVEFDDFTEARTYEIYERMPGEKGGIFRDSERGDSIKAKLEAARADAKKRCFIGAKKPPQRTIENVPSGAPPAAQ